MGASPLAERYAGISAETLHGWYRTTHLGRLLEDRVGPFAMRADLKIDVNTDEAGKKLHVSGAGEDRQIASRISATLDLVVAPADGGSEVVVNGRYEITGKVATLGAGAIRKKGDKVLDDFFTSLERELS